MKIYLFNIMQFYEESDRTVNKSIMYFETRCLLNELFISY